MTWKLWLIITKWSRKTGTGCVHNQGLYTYFISEHTDNYKWTEQSVIYSYLGFGNIHTLLLAGSVTAQSSRYVHGARRSAGPGGGAGGGAAAAREVLCSLPAILGGRTYVRRVRLKVFVCVCVKCDVVHGSWILKIIKKKKKNSSWCYFKISII